MLGVVARGAMSGSVLGGAGWEAFAADAASYGPTPGNGSSAAMGANVDDVGVDASVDTATSVEVPGPTPGNGSSSAVGANLDQVGVGTNVDTATAVGVPQARPLDAGEADVYGKRHCALCRENKDVWDFSNMQLKRIVSRRACMVCIDAENMQLQPLRHPPKTAYCVRCATDKGREHFSASQLTASARKRRCKSCIEAKYGAHLRRPTGSTAYCVKCRVRKIRVESSTSQHCAAPVRRKCIKCLLRASGKELLYVEENDDQAS